MSLTSRVTKLERKVKSLVCKLKKLQDQDGVLSIDNLEVDVDNNLILSFTTNLGSDTVSVSLDSFDTLQIKSNVLNYTELLTVPSPDLYDFAYVREAQGTAWLPGSAGGTYYGSGLYMFDGTNWIEDDTNVFTQLDLLVDHTVDFNNPHSVTKSQVGLGDADNTSDLDKPVSTAQQLALDGKADTVHNHVEADITDNITVYINADLVLPDSTSFTGTITVKNVSTSMLNVNTLVADKLEQEDTQIIYPDESFTIRLYQVNDYRIV